MFRSFFGRIILALIFFCCTNSYSVFAQQEFLLRGAIFQKQNGQRVADALITDQKSKVVIASNNLGGFNIKTTVGDTLRIAKKDFTEYIYVVSTQQDLIIQLSPVIQLGEVRIVGQSKKQELDEAMRQYRSQGSFYNGKPPALAMATSPITGLYELFGKTPRQAKHFQEFYKLETEQINVDKRFTKRLIQQVTDLEEAQIAGFMDSYRPSYDQLAEWNDYDLINYIKKSAIGFKEGKGLPPLKKLY